MWRGIVDDVSPDFTVYKIVNQPWNTYLHEKTTFEFRVQGYANKGLPSLKIGFQGQVYGEEEEDSYSSGSSGDEGSGDGRYCTVPIVFQIKLVNILVYLV